MKRSPLSLVILALATLAPAAAPAEGLDVSKPLRCSLTDASECDGVALCQDVTFEQIELPSLWRVDFAAKQLTSENGQRVRIYTLTAAGEKQLAAERSKWQRLTYALAGLMLEPRTEGKS